MGILIVDDSPDELFLFRLALESAGYKEIIIANSAKEAFDILEKSKSPKSDINVDLILMDLVMPDIDGIEACRRIKDDDQLRDIPIVIVTALNEIEHLESAFNSGAMDYLTKPVRKAELLIRVRSLLKLKREIDHRKSHEFELEHLAGQLASANRMLQRIAILDGLTGIANRRYFDEVIGEEWLRAIRDQTPLSIIMIDIDYFKVFNDTYGHQAGDEALKNVAMALKDTLKRPADMIARYGGEEFVAVLPETEIKGAVAIAEAMRLNVDALNIPHENSHDHGHITVSLGVASIVPERNRPYSVLIAAADKALYKAKEKGRNRVEPGWSGETGG